MLTFSTDYCLFVFAATVGVIQTAASLGQLRGLLIFKSPAVARVFGLALVAAAVVWFFCSEDRNLNDYEGGLDGVVQARLFFFGALSAVAATLGLSSLLNVRMKVGVPAPGEGLDALKRTNYARALAQSLRYWRREWRTQTKRYFFG